MQSQEVYQQPVIDNQPPVTESVAQDSPSMANEPTYDAPPDQSNSDDLVAREYDSGNDEEIPEWGRKDPTRYMSTRLNRIQDKHRREMNEMLQRMNELQNKVAQPQQQYQPQQNYQQPLIDPLTNQYVDPNSVEGQVVMREQMRQQLAEAQRSQLEQYEQQKHYERITDNFIEKMEESRSKFNDYDSVVNSVQISAPILEMAKLLPDGSDLLYYLCKNPKEVNRMTKLPAAEQAQALAKHAIDFQAKKNSKAVSRAPEPAKPLTPSAEGAKPSLRNMDAKQISQYMRDKAKSKYRR